MTHLISVCYDINLKENSIIWIYSELNSSIPCTLSVIYSELPKLANELLYTYGIYYQENLLFQPYQSITLSIVDNKVQDSNLMAHDNKNPYIEAITTIIDNNLLDWVNQEYGDFVENVRLKWYDYKHNRISTQEIGIYLDNIRKNAKGEAIRFHDYFNEIQHNKGYKSLSEMYMKLGFNSLISKNIEISEIIKLVEKSIVEIKIDQFSLISDLNFLENIYKNWLLNWKPTISRLILKVIESDIFSPDIKTSTRYISIIYNLNKTLGKLNINDEIFNNGSDNTDTEFETLKAKFSENFSFNPLIQKYPDTLDELYDNFVSSLLTKKLTIENYYVLANKIENWQLIYFNVLFRTNLNPDNLVRDISLSEYIQSKFNDIRTTFQDTINQNWFNFHQSNFNQITKLAGILFGNNDPNEKITLAIDLFNNVKLNTNISSFFVPRVLLFCIENFYDLDPNLIRTVIDLEIEIEYLTVNTIISKLSLALLDSKPLSDQDIYYLNEYLNQNIENYTQETISGLILTLLQLERKPKMPIIQTDGTFLVQQNDQFSESDTQSILQSKELIIIPEDIIDILFDYQSLLNYLHLFFSFQVLQREWHEYKLVDQPYNKLQHLKTYMRSLRNYMEQINTIKINHSHVVDDISLDLLEIEMILSEEPSIALGKLISVKSKMENRQKNNRDWEQFNYLLEQCHDALRIEQEITNYVDD